VRLDANEGRREEGGDEWSRDKRERRGEGVCVFIYHGFSFLFAEIRRDQYVEGRVLLHCSFGHFGSSACICMCL